MKRKANWIRQILYRVLPMKAYLILLSSSYFVFFKLGFLKNQKVYAYPNFLKNVIKSGDVCIDIGANLGYLTVLFSELVGETGKVYSVEPVKPILEVLRLNTRKCTNVEILPYALGAENKPIQLGNDTIKKQGFLATGRHKVVDAKAEVDVRFDAEMRKGSELFKDLEKLDFIKCDIEGYEVVVMQEIEPIILKHRPILLIELERKNRIFLMDFFAERDFTGFVLDKGKLKKATGEYVGDMLIIPNERVSEFREFRMLKEGARYKV